MAQAPSSRSESHSAAPSSLPRFNLGLGLLAMLITATVGIAAHLQPPYPNPSKPFAERSLVDRLLYPYEVNGELRLWQPVPRLNSIAASSNGQFILAVGDGGAAVVSRDGGAHWQSQLSGSTENLTYAWVSDDGTQGGAFGFSDQTYELRTESGAWTPGTENASSSESLDSPQREPQSSYFNNRSPKHPKGMPPGTQVTKVVRQEAVKTSADARPLLVLVPGSADCKRRWALGESGQIVSSDDCGQSWETRASALPGSLFAVTFLADGKHGWAAGYAGVLLRTTDGGERWVPTRTGIHSTVTSVSFLENGSGWMGTEDGELLASTDFGRSWRSMDMQPKLPGLSCVYFQPDGMHGRVSTDKGSAMTTADGGATWTSAAQDATTELGLMKFSPVGSSTATRSKSVMMMTSDCGMTWNMQPALDSSINVPRAAAYRISTGAAWIASADGMMLSTTDDWNTLRQSYSPARSARQAMWFTDENNGWAVGLHPALARTADGGKSWAVVPSPIEYARYPAPWFWMSLIFIAGLWIRAFQINTPPEEGVAALAASDAPTQDFSQDRLRFGPLAKGISRFLRNEATEPPLTLAITGDWGTGKSSLMTLICKDLRNNGSRPVWFNAWHHQKDEQLLAALLSAVREQSLPSLLELNGWLFRWRLLALRTRKHWVTAALLMLAGVWLAAYLASHETSQWRSLWTLFDVVSQASQKEVTPALLESLNLGPLAAKLTGLITTFIVLRKTLTAFGADPSVLLTNSIEQFRLKEANALSSFRSRFAKEFGEVTACLPGRLVVVIDDLDRCRAEAVLEVMEAVNFLVSSGKCFVIFGMATTRVQAALALSFEKIAQEMSELDASGQSSLSAEPRTEVERLRRRKYARDYLEKLINLEIAVPDAPSEQPHSLLEDVATHSTSTPAFFTRLKTVVLAMAFAATVAYAWHSGQDYQFPLSSPRPPEGAVMNTAALVKSQTAAPAATLLDSPLPANPYPPNTGLEATNDMTTLLVPIIVLAVLAGLAYALARLGRTLYTVQDSEAFKSALAAWSPLVHKHRKTPRALKRFANRLRYLAMLQQAQRLDHRGWDALPGWLRKWMGLPPSSVPMASEACIDEHRIVALGALYEVFGSDWKNCANDHFPDNALAELARQSIIAYCKPGLDITWPPSKQEIQKFSESLAGVRVPS